MEDATTENETKSEGVYYQDVLSTAARSLSKSKSTENNTHIQEHTPATNNERNSQVPVSASSSSSHHSHAHARDLTEEEAARLSSLPQRPIANFPSESDRKRVIGCLATIISMMYQYEQTNTMDYAPEVEGQNSEEEDADEDEQEQPLQVISPDDSFESMWEQTSPGKATPTSTSPVKATPTSPVKAVTEEGTGGQNKSPKNMKQLRSESAGSFSASSAPMNQSLVEKIASQRYRQRRHKVYSKFLVSAADLLFLDKSNAIAFLPLLNSLLGSEALPSTGIEEGPKRAPMEDRHGGEAHSSSSASPTPNPTVNIYYKEEADSMMLREWETKVINLANGSKHDTSIAPTKSEEAHCHQSWDNNDILLPFVESLEPGAGFQCLSLLLLNYLLQSEHGYDARIRACIKKLGVILITNELKLGECEEVERRLNAKMGKTVEDCLAEMATRKFESLEHTIASKLLRISAAQQQQAEKEAASKDIKSGRQMTRASILRGLKIGSMGVAAGTLMAVTGGLAAPGIAAGIASMGITTAATAGVVTTLTSTAAVTTVFGVGGGGLAAYKTHRRTKGVTEFTFQKQGKRDDERDDENAELFSTICISGWLKDDKDFERPWGVDPSNPPLDRMEKLVRFYSIHKPDNISRCQEILRRWKGEERELWSVLREKYGHDPDHVYPMHDSPHRRLCLTHEEDEIVDNLLGELGYTVSAEEKKEGPFRDMKQKTYAMSASDSCVMRTGSGPQSAAANTSIESTGSDPDKSQQDQNSKTQKKPVVSSWDYQMEYGGELLTVKWESDLLVELCDSVADMAADMVGQAAREILKQTALAALITAVALPYAIVRAADMIDGVWTLAIERADLAGIELAKSLLESQAGHRPVVLVGYSMGARTIYSCLKELARQQEIWEEQQEEIAREKAAKKKGKRLVVGVGKGQRKKAANVPFVREPASIVEDAIMMGLPNHLSLHSWEACRRVVAGRLVNCYTKKDLILSLMFQIKRLTGGLRPVCGTSPVLVRGVENYNVGHIVSSHSEYCTAPGRILRMIYHGCPHRHAATIIV